MDKMIIKNLELFGFHGVNPEEKAMGQKFVVDLELTMDLRPAGLSDHIDDTLNYAQVCHELGLEFRREKFNLIEKAAENMCTYLLCHFDKITAVELCLKKPWAPIHMPVEYPAIKLYRQWHTAYIGLGSNMGDKKSYLDSAIFNMNQKYHTKVTKITDYTVTEPVGYKDQDDFLNGVCEIKTLLGPEELIQWLLSIELELKRERTIAWGPRTIDLDVLLYDSIITQHESIIIPHPRMHLRSFVLEPLHKLIPYYMHPVLNKRIYELLDALN